jgi:hypothetical protein
MVASWVLSPSSARKTVVKMVKKACRAVVLMVFAA